MLTSNQPYQQVDDGIGAGLISGGVVGGAMAGAFHMRGGHMAHGLSKAFAPKKMENNNVIALDGKKPVSYQTPKGHATANKVSNFMHSAHDKAFGGGLKGKAAAYGGSVLAAGLLGAGMDAMTD